MHAIYQTIMNAAKAGALPSQTSATLEIQSARILRAVLRGKAKPLP